MDPSTLLELTYRMLVVVLLVSLPIVGVAVVVGLVVGMLQAVTQVQDHSIGYGVKLVAVVGAIALVAAWAGGELLQYARHVFEGIPGMR